MPGGGREGEVGQHQGLEDPGRKQKSQLLRVTPKEGMGTAMGILLSLPLVLPH